MKNLPLSLLGLIFLFFAITASAQVAPDQARNFQIDATHSGAMTTNHLTPPLKQRWVVDFGQAISYPLIADGRVFVTVRKPSNGTTLFALDTMFGGLIWSADLGGNSQWSGNERYSLPRFLHRRT